MAELTVDGTANVPHEGIVSVMASPKVSFSLLLALRA